MFRKQVRLCTWNRARAAIRPGRCRRDRGCVSKERSQGLGARQLLGLLDPVPVVAARVRLLVTPDAGPPEALSPVPARKTFLTKAR